MIATIGSYLNKAFSQGFFFVQFFLRVRLGQSEIVLVWSIDRSDPTVQHKLYFLAVRPFRHKIPVRGNVKGLHRNPHNLRICEPEVQLKFVRETNDHRINWKKHFETFLKVQVSWTEPWYATSAPLPRRLPNHCWQNVVHPLYTERT